MKKIKTIFALVFLLATSALFGQNTQPPFWDEIKTFNKEDSAHFPAANQILFVGSSSFRMWENVQSDFPEHKIINRGFGGSSLPDVIRYADQIIMPYKPKQVVIYCGENDLAASDTVASLTVFNRFKTLFETIRAENKNTPIVFVSIKPSPSRRNLLLKMKEANKFIENFLKKQKQTVFVDVYNKMLDSNGQPRADLFLEDDLHMNEKGYAIWRKAIQPHLKK